MPAPIRVLPSVTVGGLTFIPSLECGAYFAVMVGTGLYPQLLTIAMPADVTPDFAPTDDDIVEVCCVEADDPCLPFVNRTFGTHFTPADFFGR